MQVPVWLSALCTVVSIVTAEDNGPLVDTPSGPIRGLTVSSPSGRQVDAYLGIPYAEPPLGALRFKPPQPLRPWTSVLQADRQPPSCMQKPYPFSRFHAGVSGISPRTDVSEDCLKLNLWTPKRRSGRVPVLVFIYGGGFSRGGASVPAYDGTILAAEEEIIVVTFNYRLSSFGFLFLDHQDAPGNVGMLDQVMALTWLRDNVAALGGDPGSVVVYGHSAGSASIGYHLLSDLSKDLFRDCIMQSGSPHDMWAFARHETALHFASQLAENSGCPYSKTNASFTAECLRKLDANELLHNEPVRLYDYVYNFVPTVDGVFLKAEPAKLLKKGIKRKVNLMTGNVRDESTLFLSSFLPLIFPLRDDFSFKLDDARETVQILVGLSNITMQTLMMMYLNPAENRIGMSYLLEMAKRVGSDAGFICNMMDFEDAVLSARGTVHKYYFTHRSSNSKWPKWFGTVHGEDFRYAFGEPLIVSENYTKAEELLSRRMMKYWANFARTGNPNGRDNGDTFIKWPRMTEEFREYLVMAPNSTSTGRNFRARVCSYWREYLPKIEAELGPELLRITGKESLFERIR